jgi:hypothetical protein
LKEFNYQAVNLKFLQYFAEWKKNFVLSERLYVRIVKRRGRNLMKDMKSDEIRVLLPLFIDEPAYLG